MNKGPNLPQQPGNNRRRRRGPKKKQNSAPGLQSGPKNGGSGRRGRNNRRQPAAFIGPMDHSYRNGQNGQTEGRQGSQNNRFRGGHNGGYTQQRFVEQDMTPVAATRLDAPARIFCFVDDLFFLAKIQETARKLNVKVEFVKTTDPILERAHADVPDADKPALVIFDLNNANIKPLAMIPKLRSKLKKGTSIIGFVSHLQGDLKLKAQEAGCDMVMPRSAFSQNLPQLLRRHGSADERDESMEQPGMQP